MSTATRLAALLGPTLLLVAATAAAQGSEDLPRDIRLDHSLALPDSGSARLEFHLEIPYERLVFERADSGFAARLRIAGRARRESDHEETTLLRHASVRAADFAASRRKGQHFTEDFALELGAGRWDVELLLYARGPARPWRDAFAVEVPDSSHGTLFLQGPRWAGGRGQGALTPPFFFRDIWRIPDDRSHFADGAPARAALSCELLNWSQESLEAEAVLSVEDARGKLAHYARRVVEVGPGRQALDWELPVNKLGMGAYLVDIDLRVQGESERRRLTGRLDVGLTQAAFDRDWERTQELVRPLASLDEREDLAAALPRERLVRWRAFWARRDPGGDAPGNPALEAFCEHVSDANRRFGAGARDGYLSDRGQVYLQYGPPDRVETTEDEGNFRTLEVWTYDRQGLVYVFEDRHGAGDFVLLRVMNG
ncbi:MAG: GWxTD domain-containing protein [Candidatus Krumholzibacteriia bacterium]|nr:GWxTD domain-containing protein [bacterium]MCB9514750.1 GWxTD domain-containing protein [Candidatus Latescibacterota bacterium]